MEESNIDSEEEMVVVFCMQMCSFSLAASEKRQHGGSLNGKVPNKQRNYAAVPVHYIKKYFWPSDQLRPNTTSYGTEKSESTFERRFRMSRTIFNKTCFIAVSHSEFIRKGLKPDCTGSVGISPLIKV